jgi:hypothetical protein
LRDRFVSLRPLSTPGDQCLKLSLGTPDPLVVERAVLHRFDQLPVVNCDGQLVGLVATDHVCRLGDDEQQLLESDPELYRCEVSEHSPLAELLERFSSQRALTFPDQGDRFGFALVTISDLNRHPFRSHLYPIIAELEASCAEVIERRYVDPWTWIPYVPEAMQIRLIGRWEFDKRNSIDTSPITGCTLTEILTVIASLDDMRDPLGYRSPRLFRSATGSLPDLRNRIMHPVRPLVTTQADVVELLSSLRLVSELTAKIAAISKQLAA